MNVHLWDFLFAAVGGGVFGPIAYLAGTLRCQHPLRRCIHGDEIIAEGGARSRCLRCGKALRELPLMCTATGMRHGSRQHSQARQAKLERKLGL